MDEGDPAADHKEDMGNRQHRRRGPVGGTPEHGERRRSGGGRGVTGHGGHGQGRCGNPLFMGWQRRWRGDEEKVRRRD